VFSLIEQSIAGHRTKIKLAVEAPDFSPQEFAQTCRLGVGELEDKYQINGTQAQRLVEAGETLFRQIEEQVIDYAVDVELDIGSGSGTRQYRKLDDLSKGQKATALLLLLLSAAQGTLIIDQPEDDLDNRFIYEGVVKRLRQLKGVRQVIVATHNANVPVLGDAELLVVLDGDGEHGYLVQDGVGSLDDPSIRRLVEDVLEGGQAAFTARQHLYGF
jgi:ATPase subunit of ABC transporter with duplicated ATPase domains